MEHPESLNDINKNFLKTYAYALFKYVEEEKEKTNNVTNLLEKKIDSIKKTFKLKFTIILLLLFYILIYMSGDIVKVKNYQNYIYNNINESETFSELFYKSISDNVVNLNNDFSYEPYVKDYIKFKNIHTKFDLSSWIKYGFIENVLKKFSLNNNILINNCWRISIRLYKKKNELVKNVYNYKKVFDIYSDSAFLKNVENTRDIDSFYFQTKWKYSFSFDKSYKQLGGLYQIICGEDYKKMENELSQNTNYATTYPYFIPAIILTNYNVAAVTLDFILYNPSLDILSYNILKFAFLPNSQTNKKIKTLCASYNQFNIPFIIYSSIFLLLFVIYIVINSRKAQLVGFKSFMKLKYTQLVLIVCLFLNLTVLGVYYLLCQLYLSPIKVKNDIKEYQVGSFPNKLNSDMIPNFLNSIGLVLANIEFVRSILINITIVNFVICCIICLVYFGLLIRKYKNVEKNIIKDFLIPFFIVLIIIFICLVIFLFFYYKYVDFVGNYSFSSTFLYIFIFNICVIFSNFQMFRVSSITSEEGIGHYYYLIPYLFFIITITFAFVLFLAIKPYFKRIKHMKECFFGLYTRRIVTSYDSENESYSDRNGSFSKLKNDSNDMYSDNCDININIDKESGSNNNSDCLGENNKSYSLGDGNCSTTSEGSDSGNDSGSGSGSGSGIDSGSGSDSDSNSGNESGCDNKLNLTCVTLHQTNTNNTDNYMQNGDNFINDIYFHNNKKSVSYSKRVFDKDMITNSNCIDKPFFNIEKILNFVFKRNFSFLPFSYKKKKSIKKKYKSNKKDINIATFYIYLLISVSMFFLLFFINNYNKISKCENIIRYQIRNIGYSPSKRLFTHMQFNYLNKNINVQTKTKNLTLHTIQTKDDLINWIKDIFCNSFLKIELLVNNYVDSNYYSTFKWEKLFSIKNDVINIKVVWEWENSKNISHNSYVCNKDISSCKLQNNEKNNLQTLINVDNIITLITNENVKNVRISFIFLDQKDFHNILVTIYFHFNPSGYITKNIYLNHLFFNSFRISNIKGMIINLIFIIVIVFFFIVLYLHSFVNFSIFYRICYFELQKVDDQKTKEVDDITIGQFGNQAGYSNGGVAYGNENVFYGGNGLKNYDNADLKKKSNKKKNDFRVSLFLKLNIYAIYVCEGYSINLITLLLHLLIILLWLVMFIYINMVNYYKKYIFVYLDLSENIFSVFTTFINIFYIFLFFNIIHMFIFVSNTVKKEKIYEALYINRKQLLKCMCLWIFFYFNFFMFNYFFNGIDGFNDLTLYQQCMYSILVLLGLAELEIYLKCKLFYFFFFVLPHWIFIRFILIYSLLAPIIASYIILIKEKKKKTDIIKRNSRRKKKKKNKILPINANQNFSNSYSDFTLTRLSNEQWKCLNDEIKLFADKENQKIYEYFETFKNKLQDEQNVTISKFLSDTCEQLREKIHKLNMDIRRIKLQWKFKNKLLNSSNMYLEKINKEVAMKEEMVSEDKKRLSSLNQYAEQLKLDSLNKDK
ncbi:conserved membrane protein, unknown function [Hepatocystis sp. ex Piliocolobus tephrosceles]|nr:conserved membrane protein, unknown function [Hepatocystis sp. ex Piliocolobus tephrosceles]